MKRKIYLTAVFFVLLCSPMWMCSCEDDETYAEQKERERNAINSFLKTGTCVMDLEEIDTLLYVAPIKVISEKEFLEDTVTDISENEYVFLNSTGIYMQIVDKGTGEKLQSGETTKVYNRFTEFNILGDSIMLSNNNLYYISVPDEMTVTNSLGVFTGSYLTGVMRNSHSSTSVPEGWLVPLTYINLGRYDSETASLAKVRLIVPHTSGTTEAQSSVYPCFYEITYQKGR